MSLRLAVILLLLSASACGGDDDDAPDASVDPIDASIDAASQTDSGVTYTAQLFRRDCGPTDGPAITVSLSGDADRKTCTADFTEPAVLFSVYGDFVIDAPLTVTFDDSFASGDGRVCGEDLCEPATAGEIRFDSFVDGDRTRGTWQLTTAGGTTSGSFNAEWCEPEGGGPFCG
jgi:hypothetical protein